MRDLGALSLHREVFSLDKRMDDQIKSAQLNIRDLVSQVKSGELDKTAAFDNLQSILRANTGQANGGPETADGTMGGEGASTRGGKASTRGGEGGLVTHKAHEGAAEGGEGGGCNRRADEGRVHVPNHGGRQSGEE